MISSIHEPTRRRAARRSTLDDADDVAATGNRCSPRALRFELIFASIWLAVGLFVLPATDLRRRRRAARAVRRQRRARPLLRRFLRRSRRAVGARLGDRARTAGADLAPAPGVRGRRARGRDTAARSSDALPPPRRTRPKSARRVEPRVSARLTANARAATAVSVIALTIPHDWVISPRARACNPAAHKKKRSC